MEIGPTGTKFDLINAAGELFAEHGLDGTSVRAIAEKAGANIAAINYHFGSKENLYTEVFEYVVKQDDYVHPTSIGPDDPRLDSPEGIAEVIYQLVREQFRAYFIPDHPRWYGRFVMRSLMDATPALEAVLRQSFEPDHEALASLFRKARPGLTQDEAQFYAFSLTAQAAFYEFCREPVLMHLGKDRYDQAFLIGAADHIARMTITALGLPLPEGLRPCAPEDRPTEPNT